MMNISKIIVIMVATLTVLIKASGCSEGQQVAQPLAATNKKIWEGVWVAERHFGPLLRGALTIQKSGDQWVATIQGETIRAERQVRQDGSISWSASFFGEGRFIGRQANAKAVIEGHWYQPPSRMENYSIATPVRLALLADGAFSGTIAPLNHQASLNIILRPDADVPDDTRYRTFLRNPERNLGAFFPIHTAIIEQDHIHFFDESGQTVARGNIKESGKRFSLFIPYLGEEMDFFRRPREAAPGFYGRRAPQPDHPLLKPVQIEGDWPTATLAEAGFDAAPIRQLIYLTARFVPNDVGAPYVHSLLIARGGKLVLEEYFNGYDRDTPHDSRSAGKTLTSALLGAALHQGTLTSVDQPVYPLFGGVKAFENPDDRKGRMTIRHLITMTSGFDCDDTDDTTPGHEDTMQSQERQPDWYRYTLDLPMSRAPGDDGAYCTAGINLVGGIIAKAAGMSLPRFFDQAYAKPLNIQYYQMNLSPNDQAYMGGGVRLRPRDFLKLGQLYLNDGVWNGQRFIPEGWVAQSFAPSTSLNKKDDYGFAWWRNSLEANGETFEAFYASGNGGQIMFVVPALDIVGLLNAGNYGDGLWGFLNRRLESTILPAAMAGK